MTFIQNLLTRPQKNEQLKNIIDKCTKLKEIDIYLHNLDREAQINQGVNLTEQNRRDLIAIEGQNIKLGTIMQSKILEIMLNANINQKEVYEYALKIRAMFEEDLDIADMDKEQMLKACKRYVVAKIVMDNINFLQMQQKTLYSI